MALPYTTALEALTKSNVITKELQDNLSKNNALMWVLHGKKDSKGVAKAPNFKRTEDGGSKIEEPLLYGSNPNMKSFEKGDTFNLDPFDGVTRAQFTWKSVGGPIVFYNEDLDLNQDSKDAIVRLMTAGVQQATITVEGLIAPMLYGDGTGNGGKDFDGLDAFVSISPTTGTVGGIDAGTYTWWRNAATTMTGSSFGTYGLNRMSAMYNSLVRGAEKPTLLITDVTTFGYYENKLTDLQRYIEDKDFANAGFSSLLYKRTPIIFDYYATDERMYFLNTKFINYVVLKNRDMSLGKWIEPVNADEIAAKLIHRGDLTISNRALQGVLYAIDTE